MSGKDKKACGDVLDDWKEFFWNPRTREFMGRTGSSWALILLFYLVFYCFLTGLFALTMWVMLQTLDDYKPTYQDRLATPGMMIRPRSKTLDITYSMSNTETWDGYVNTLNEFLLPYNDSIQAANNYFCPPGQYFTQDDSDNVRNNPKRSCQFNRTMLEDCSGLEDQYYGYRNGQPCVLIKLNRVIGMKPGDGEAPYVTCTGKKYKVSKDTWKEDSDKIGEIVYFPPNGTFNLMYYPYYGKQAQVNYSQPLVAVKFLNLTMNTDINVECRIMAKNIKVDNERDKFAGRVSFLLRIDKI
ncbi:sodium/potassium-transporting ATPase subunit beta-2-like isoform X1 [Polyodon spathula]|uniref:sodium/potassium-transporting ATPase subunit beta-2-like isoform X1 n=2 Tax=Polyodon spathula TaxID=7913 RepID=UPI001B7ED635|nr:sodium/potassium-transporting ATPase subunit beta-2-like isoform X1 [Polyodon spathula]